MVFAGGFYGLEMGKMPGVIKPKDVVDKEFIEKMQLESGFH